MGYRLVKRGLDIFAAALGLLVLWPIFLYVAWMIRRDTPGPAFYRSPRVGKDGRIFRMLKFRTMYERAESYAGPKVTAHDDPRITPLGKRLREIEAQRAAAALERAERGYEPGGAAAGRPGNCLGLAVRNPAGAAFRASRDHQPGIGGLPE